MALFVFAGNDLVSVRDNAHAFLDTHTTGSYERIEADALHGDVLQDLAGGTSLFGGTALVLIDTPSESEDALLVLTEHAALLSESPNTFVVVDMAHKAAEKKILKKYATEYVEIAEGKKKEAFNVFSLTDALLRHDKRSLWVLLNRARLAGATPEELIGTLFWQVKTMRLAAVSANASEAGLKPFVYSKAKSGLQKFSKEEIDSLSDRLIRVYHDGHAGKTDIDNALERFVLSI